MPMYEYCCAQCSRTFELFRRMDDHPDRCPFCNTRCTVQLQISAGSFQLTGTGWYKTDYKSQ